MKSRVARLCLVVAAASLLLSGCSVFDTIGGWFSSSGKKSNLRGVRIPVMSLDSELKVDATLAKDPVLLPPPYRNPDWPQPGGYASNAMYHLAVPGRLRQAWERGCGQGLRYRFPSDLHAGGRRRADLCFGCRGPYLGVPRRRWPSRLEQAAGAQERHRFAHAVGPARQSQHRGPAARGGRGRGL